MNKIALLFLVLSLHTIALFSQELYPYVCDVERVDIRGFESSRSFDEKGVIISKKQYHPLAIAQYGLLSYYEFYNSGDSSYYKKCINQAKYFFDSSRVHFTFDGKGVSLPYNRKFWDLKAPWYSGMTQGYSISYMLRYYKLTSDKRALDLVEKLAYAMLQPQKEGGAISTTPEGYVWIEEYPNSKRSPQVLNGYINALIGLKEYTDFFPRDTAACRILDDTYYGLVQSLEYFDSPTWSYYNRAKKSIPNKYLRYQIYEMKHLYEIFGDEVFEYQKRIWSTMVYNRFIRDKSKHHRFREHNMSEPIKKIHQNKYGVPLSDTLFVASIDSTNIDKLSFRQRRKLKLPRGINWGMVSKGDSLASTNFLKVITNVEVPLSKFQIFTKKDGELKEVSYMSFSKSNTVFLAFEENVDPNKLFFRFDRSKTTKNISISKVDLYNTNIVKPPFYAHFKSKIYELEKEKEYLIKFDEYNTDKAVIFYKHSTNRKIMNKSKWKALNVTAKEFTPQDSGSYQFMVVFDYLSPISMIGEFSIDSK